jgi:signal transduction histidine kinase
MVDPLSQNHPRLIYWLIHPTLQIATAVLALVAIVYFAVLFYFLAPYTGATLSFHKDALMIEAVDAKGPAAKAGAQAGDWILSINGRSPIEVAHQMMSRDLGIKPDDVVLVKARRGDQTLSFSVTLGSYLDAPSAVAIASSTYIVALGLWGVGLAMCLFTSPHDVGPRLVALCWLVGAISVATGGPIGVINLMAYNTMMVTGCLAFALFMVAHLYFPRVSLGARLRKHLVYSLAAATLLLSTLQILDNWAFSHSFAVVDSIGIPLYTTIDIFQFLCLSLAIGMLVRNRFVTQDANAKRQMSIIIWGIALSGIPYSAAPFLNLFSNTLSDLAYTCTLLLAAFVPLTYAYVIYQRELVRVDFAINRFVVLFTLTLITLAAFALLSLGAARALDLPIEAALLSGVAAAGASLLAPRLRQVVQRRVDRVLYGCHYDFGTITSTFSERLTQAIDRDALTHLLVHDLADQMGIRQAALFLTEGDTLKLQSSDGNLHAVPLNSAVCRTLLAARESVRADPLWEKHPAAQERWKAFAWARLFVPLIFQNRLQGLLLLSDRFFGDIYSAADVRIVAAVAHQAALAFENVRLVESLRGLNRQIVRSDEAQRKRVARDLHDTAMQQLFFVKQGLFRHQDTLGTQIDLLEDTIQTLRRTVRGLRPPLLDQGLAMALEGLVEEMQKMAEESPSIALQSNVNGRLNLSDEQATALYRIAQEALTNALKHAQAQRIVVALEARENELELSIADDGAGMLEEREGHYGLTGMRERAAMAGAKLDVISAPGQGTRITVKVIR